MGLPVKERESYRLITGSGLFVDDVKLPNTAYMSVLRSPISHAKLSNVDAREALKQKGVLAAITSKDVIGKTRPLRTRLSIEGIKVVEHHCLAGERLRYVGEPFAAIVADDPYAARDAIDAMSFDYERLDPIVMAEDGLKQGAGLLYPEWGDNVALRRQFSNGDVDKAFSNADIVLREKIASHRYTGTPIETRAYCADYNPRDKSLTFYASTQNPHVARTLLAEALGFPENKIRVVMPDVGGAFGLKHPLYHEEILVAFLSIQLGRPVKWSETRTENLQSMHHAREQVHHVEVAAKSDGSILGLRDKIIVDLGAYYPTAGPFSALVTAHYLPGPYRIQDYAYELLCIVTNKTPYGAYRGFGKADSNFVMERIMDKLARKLGVDPAEIRMRNLIDSSEFPYRTATGAIYDSGDYKRALSKLLEIIDYPSVKRKQRSLRSKGGCEGIGLAFILEPSGVSYPGSFLSNYDSVTIRMDPSGKVTVLSGGAPQGQSYETVTAQLVADILGIGMDEISVTHGDTQLCPYGLGSYSSRFSVILAPAIAEAATQIRKKLLKAASHFLNVEESSLKLDRGYMLADSEEKMEIRTLARMLYTKSDLLPPGMGPGLETTVVYSGPQAKDSHGANSSQNMYLAYPYAAAAVIVRVDSELGEVEPLRYCIVHDCGNVINEAIVEGQLVGGAVQGLGGALYEELVYNQDGDLLTSTFMDYLIPSARELPIKIELHRTVTPSPFVPGGYKGAGEAGTLCSPPVFANAVEDALSKVVSGVDSMPLKPEALWRKVREGDLSK